MGVKEGYNYIGTKDVNFDNTINYDNGVKIPFNEPIFRNAYKGNTLICVEGGSAGRKVAKLTEDVCFGNKLAAINSWIINPEYIYLVFQSSIIQNFFKNNMTGIIGGVSINKLKTFLIPIPPLREQKRIVSKYQLFISLISKYGNEYYKIETLNTNYKEELKKSILQYAIQGKLVKQDSNDEPAKVLINKILNERRALIKTKQIKKENLSVIYKDSTDDQFYEKFDDGKIINITEEIPFEIPDSWRWIKLKTIAFVTKLAGFEYTKNIFPNLTKSGIPLFKGKNVQNGKLVLDFESYIPEQVSTDLPRSQLTKKCLLTPYVGTIGNIAIFDGSFKAHLGSNVGKIELYGNILEEYILYYLRSYTGNCELKKFKKATAQESISIDALRECYIALPPLNEQNRIVEKIKNIFEYIETAE